MKLLHTVVRFCGTRARNVSGRGVIAVPRDFHVTVPAPLGQPDAVDASMVAAHPELAFAVGNQVPSAMPAMTLPPH